MTFQGRKGNSKWSWRRIYLKNKDVGGKWLPKTGSFTRTCPSDIFAVGVWDSTAQGFFSSPPQAARLLKPDISLKHYPPPPGQTVSRVNYSRTSAKQQEQPISSFWAGSLWTSTLTGGKQVAHTWRSHPKCKYLTHRWTQSPPKLIEELGCEWDHLLCDQLVEENVCDKANNNRHLLKACTPLISQERAIIQLGEVPSGYF